MATNVSHVDLSALVEDWALTHFRRRATRKERKLLEQDMIMMDVDWKRVDFQHMEPTYDPEPPTPGKGTPINNILFHTSFTNKTDHQQTYTFKTERTTRSTCAVQIEQGYTQGVETSVKLATPCGILEANAGFHREISVTNSKEQTVEEELCWGVDSQVNVKGKHRAEAKLIIKEEEYKGHFLVQTCIKGRVRVVFTNLKDNNSFIRVREGEIVEIVREALEGRRPQGDAISIDGATRSVVCRTRGKCMFRYGLQQNVEVDQFPMNSVTY
ncbi:hypothetical protein CAPTEDRAFT_134512 [Capitella teleta]|uniref:Uncharacterized protein n=1 Tax=Capitella teleta TaxID=283909 RepID=R7UR01_CAPTE|nr:hypothetical protein CAPTEDRAFT_134512 [Capitella teleta]|eukprot:ELU08575.1 hypothetical protein CAPTEDRAFT_134512 [Capitella teleta]